jgi:hypothetical protein
LYQGLAFFFSINNRFEFAQGPVTGLNKLFTIMLRDSFAVPFNLSFVFIPGHQDRANHDVTHLTQNKD